MRNLKRALSLTLASIMLLGMMVVGSSAASYQDVTDEHNVEAIEVLQAVGIMVGDEGNFNPDKNVTRNEMAVIMSNLMDYRVASYSGTSPFTDVPAWAEPYVAACYTNGITSGTSPTTYNGSGNVTTAQAALMIMKALGYFQYASDFKDDWMLETTRQAGKIDLLVDVEAGVRDAMTRNDVAQLVLNGLKTGMVEVDDSNKVEVSNGDMQVSVGGAKYVYVTSREKYAEAIYDIKVESGASNSANLAAPIVELGEKLYQGDLTLEDWEYDRDSNPDDFGRPSRTWTYQAKDIGTYAEEADIVFTASVTSKALYNAVGSTAAEKYTWTIRNNGEIVYSGADKKGFPEMVKNQTNDSDDFFNKAGLTSNHLYSDKEDLTGNGVLTEIFLDGNKETVTVSVTDFYAAEVYQVKDGKISLSSIEADAPADTSYEFDATGFEEDEIVYYTFAKDKIQSVTKADRIEGEVTKVVASTSDENGKNFDLDGENYKYLYTMDTSDALTTENVANDMVGYTMTLGEKAYCLYIDWAAVTYDYAYVLSAGFDSDKADNSNKDNTVWARLVLTDGSMLTVETDNKAKGSKAVDDGLDYLRDHVVSYSKNTNGVYTLKVKDDKSDVTDGTNGAVSVPQNTKIFENGRSRVDSGTSKTWVANNNTVFIVAESGDAWGDYSFSVYTGVESIPDITARSAKTSVCVAATDKGVAKVVYVQDADVSGNGSVIFVIANTGADVTLAKDGTRYYSLTAYENGQKIDFNVKDGSDAYTALISNATANFGKGGAYETINLGYSAKKFVVPVRVVTLNNDDMVTSVKFYEKGATETYVFGTGTSKNDNGAVGLNDNGSWYVLKDARQIRYDVDDDAYSVSGISSVKKSAKDQYVGVIDDGDLIGLFVVDYAETGEGGNEGDNTYTVTVNPDPNAIVMNGTTQITAAGTEIKVENGKTLTLTITAKDGYTVEVTGATKGEGNTYTVSAAGTVTVKATPEGEKTLTTKNGFVITYKLIPVGNKTYMNASITYPGWVGNTAGTTVSGKVGVYIGSAEVSGGTKTLTFTRTAGTEATGEATVDLGIVIDSATMTIKEDSSNKLVASNVKVKVEGTNADKLVSTYTKEVASTGAAVSITLATSSTDTQIDSNVKYTVKNGTAAVGAETAVTGTSSKAFSTASITPADGYVVVTLTGLDKLTQSYTVTPLSAKKLDGSDAGTGLTITGGDGLSTPTIALAGSPASGASGTSVIKATLANGLGTGNAALDVKIKLASGEEFEGTFKGNGAISVGEVTLDKNYDLSKGTITITQQKALAIDTTAEGTTDGVKIEGTTYTIYFNHNIKLKDGVDATTLVDNDDGKTVESVKADGNKLIVVLNAALGASKKIQVTDVADGITCAEHGDALAEDFDLVDTTP